jgi:PAS domain S-box-containing protein
MPDDVSSLVHQTLLGDALEHAEVAVAVFADDGRYLACNTALCELTGYSRAEIAGMRVGVDLAPEGESNEAAYHAILAQGNVVTHGRIQRKDGPVLEVNVWAIPASAAGLPYYVVLYWDERHGPERTAF